MKVVLARGEKAPEFSATAQSGSPFSSRELEGAPAIVYFYPKANSAGCTRESQEFAHHFDAFARRGVRIVGVSVDDVAEQRRMTEKCSLPFPLLADTSKEVARKFGVLGAFGHAKRVTFLLDAQGRVLEVVDSFLPGPHVQRARDRWLSEPSSQGTPPGV